MKGFKEWAFIVDALGKGKQNIILRKGGLIEDGGSFKAEAESFILFPTQFHQSTDLIKPSWKPFLNGSRFRIDDHHIRLQYFAKVADSRIINNWEVIKKLDAHHAWTEEVIKERFERWEKNVHLMVVQVYELLNPVTVLVRPEYSGCKSWIDLEEEIDLSGRPVLNPEIH